MTRQFKTPDPAAEQHGTVAEGCYVFERKSLGKRIRFSDLPEECRRSVEVCLA